MTDETKGEDFILGGNITLSGFKEVGRGEVVVVKKMVGSYVRKLSDGVHGFESLKLTLKPVHRTESSEKFEIHAMIMVNGAAITSEITDRNLFVGIDFVLKKILELAAKK